MQASHCSRLNALFTAAFLDDPLSVLLAGQKKLALRLRTAFALFANCAGAGAPSAERYADRSRFAGISEIPFALAKGWQWQSH